MSAPRPDASRGDGAPLSTRESRGSKCAICGKSQDTKFKPFCSKRCADIDLGRWLKGSYAIPAEDPPDFDDKGSSGDEV